MDPTQLSILAAWYSRRYADPVTVAELADLDPVSLSSMWADYQHQHCPGCGAEIDSVAAARAEKLILVNVEDQRAHRHCLVVGLPDPAEGADGPLRWVVACPADDGLPAYYGFNAQAVQLVVAPVQHPDAMVIAVPKNHASWISQRLGSGLRGGHPIYESRERALDVARLLARV